MRISPPATIILTAAFLLGGCTTTKQPSNTHVASNFIEKQTQLASNFIYRQKVEMTTKETYPARSAKTVTVFTQNQTPHAAYRVIGVATVSKYNFLGMQREDATVHNMMKDLAASVGGDGLININVDGETMQAKIIQFQKILI